MALITKTKSENTLSENVVNQISTIKTDSEKIISEKNTESKKRTQINIEISNETKEKWKVFFTKRGMTLKSGIGLAVEYFIKQNPGEFGII